MEASASSMTEEGYRKLTLSAEKPNEVIAKPQMNKISSLKLEDDFRMFQK